MAPRTVDGGMIGKHQRAKSRPVGRRKVLEDAQKGRFFLRHGHLFASERREKKKPKFVIAKYATVHFIMKFIELSTDLYLAS